MDQNENFNFTVCKKLGCNKIISFDNLKNMKIFSCDKCFTKHCIKCKSTCQDCQCNRIKSKNDTEFEKLVNQEKMKICPKCSRYIHKTEGCNHITCICKEEFC